MPYIAKVQRKDIDDKLKELSKYLSVGGDPGEYNYAISTLLHDLISCQGLKYHNINEAIGILECAKLELYRKVVGPYEDQKEKLNGKISNLGEQK